MKNVLIKSKKAIATYSFLLFAFLFYTLPTFAQTVTPTQTDNSGESPFSTSETMSVVQDFSKNLQNIPLFKNLVLSTTGYLFVAIFLIGVVVSGIEVVKALVHHDKAVNLGNRLLKIVLLMLLSAFILVIANFFFGFIKMQTSHAQP